MDRLVIITLLAGLAGCSANRSITLPDAQEIRRAMGSAEVVATESGFDDLSPWFARPHETRMELGRWLPGEKPTLLVTLDVQDASHAEGRAHHILAVFDPVTHRRLTPAFHYIADHVQIRRIMPGGDRQCLVYVGRKQNGPWRSDVSYILTFTPDHIDATPILGDRDPEQFSVGLASPAGPLHIAQRHDNSLYTLIAHLTWSADQKQFEWLPVPDSPLASHQPDAVR